MRNVLAAVRGMAAERATETLFSMKISYAPCCRDCRTV